MLTETMARNLIFALSLVLAVLIYALVQVG